jgi:hypothetical protein
MAEIARRVGGDVVQLFIKATQNMGRGRSRFIDFINVP